MNRTIAASSSLLVLLAFAGCDSASEPEPADEAAEAAIEDGDWDPAAGPSDLAAEPETQEWWGNPDGNCKGLDRYPEHGVYETTIVYSIDEEVPPGSSAFLPMDVERNTEEYRESAYAFFESQYGIVFDPSDPNPQVAFDGAGGQVLVQPTKTGPGDTSTHQVVGLDAQSIPQWRNKFPITNVAFRVDGYFVFILSDFVAHGEFGGEEGRVIREGDILVAGEYRMFDHKDRLLDTIYYEAVTPATVNPFAGAAESSDGAVFVAITCNTHSEIFGDGLVRGLGEMRPQEDGSTDLDFRYVMRFPSRIADNDVYSPKCKNVRPLWWW